MLGKLLATTGIAAGLVVAAAPAAHAEEPSGCTTAFVDRIQNDYYYTYRLGDGWVTVDGLDVSVNGSQIVGDTNWNVFVTQDYAGFVAAGAGAYVNCVV